MSESRRVQRVEKELRHVIANYLLLGFKDPLQGLVSISNVMAAKDLRSAKVYVSIMGTQEEQEESLTAITAHAPAIQKEVSHRLQMKFCPKLIFFLDRSLDEAYKIEKILKELKENQPPN